MTNHKFIGGVLLIVGTSIGGGLLALPVATAAGGFLNSILMLFGAWLLMTFGALCVLEVNLWLPEGSNIISMAKRTLGPAGMIIAWLAYLSLLYTLLAAYTDSATDIVSGVLEYIGVTVSTKILSVLVVLACAGIVFMGIQIVDYFNRGFMSIKAVVYVLLLVWVSPNLNIHQWEHGKLSALVPALTVIITSFGFATIVPSLRIYFRSDAKLLRRAIIIGSLIPLGIYIVWTGLILGVLPVQGEHGLLAMQSSGHAVSDISRALEDLLNNAWVTELSQVFSSMCVATSFLGVSLGLSDFLADGLGIPKKGSKQFIVYAMTYVPPLLVYLLYPGAFLIGLSIGGILCVFLLALMPQLMVWSGRYRLDIANGYEVLGGRVLLVPGIIISITIIVVEVLMDFNII